MFPYRDDNPTLRTPVVTFAIITLNVAMWILVEDMGREPGLSAAVCRLGLIPGELLRLVPPGTSFPLGPYQSCVLGYGEAWYTPLTSMFLHGSWLHLIGNMWFLWIFGNNVEDSMGRLRYALFYLLCGLAAAGFQVFLTPGSVVPMVGASGAISGVMGAYVLLYPRVRVHMIVVLVVFITRIAVPAYLMLGYWFLLQLLGGAATAGTETGGTAFWAHVGGFLAGALLIIPFRDPQLVARHRALARTMGGHVWARE
ncbi:MAG TPA: rhomboid family intramembrane serine protease [Gemmatimonadales bacterium]|nr:rhomboid family intramembrane serine protease [Gemmatimonadales bacterium]